MTLSPYTRVTVQGETLNARTAQFFAQVQIIYTLLGGTGTIRLVQGSYTGDVAASFATHTGGGALDTWPLIQTARNFVILQRAKRICGGAAWDRPELWRNGVKVWDHHDHCIVIGDREMAPNAAKQVQDYFARLNGLADHAPDNSWRPSVIPVFSYPLQTVDLSNVAAEARKKSGWVERPGVKRIQSALNLKTGTMLAVDGIFGKRTKTAYARYEKQVGGDGDGIPATWGLTLLGAARFNVRP